MWRIALIGLLLWLPGPGRAQEDGIFYQTAFGVLHQIIKKGPPHYSEEAMAKLVQASGLEEKEVRTRLLAGLKEMEQHRKKKTDTWKELTQLGREEVSQDQTGKFMHKLFQGLEKTLKGKGNYLLDSSVERASGRARIFADQGYFLVAALLDAGRVTDDDDGPKQAFKLLVSGHTNPFELNKDPLFLFLGSRDEDFVLEEVREMQRFVVPRLITKMPQSPVIKWAVRQRESNVLVQPDYHLTFGVDGLHFAGSNTDLRPCMEATIELTNVPTKKVVLRKSFKHCTEKHGSATTHQLHPFYDEMAQTVYDMIDGYLAQRP